MNDNITRKQRMAKQSSDRFNRKYFNVLESMTAFMLIILIAYSIIKIINS